MAPYDDWNKIEDDEDEELQDYSVRYIAIEASEITSIFGHVALRRQERRDPILH